MYKLHDFNQIPFYSKVQGPKVFHFYYTRMFKSSTFRRYIQLVDCVNVSPLAGGVSSAAAQRNSDNAAGKRHKQSVMLLIQLQTQHRTLSRTPATRRQASYKNSLMTSGAVLGWRTLCGV